MSSKMSSLKRTRKSFTYRKWAASASSLKKSKITTSCENILTEDIKNNEHVEHVLTTAYGVIKLILKQLNWSDLMNASEVCQEWNKVAKIIFAERYAPFWFYLYGGIDTTQRLTFNYSHLQYSKPSLCLLFLNETAATLFPCNLLPKDICVSDCGDNHRWLQIIKQQFGKSGCDIVAICSSAAKSSFVKPCMEHVSPAFACTHLPALNGISFPVIPNVKTSKFYLTKETDFNEVVRTHIGESNTLKCFMAFIGLKKRFILEQTIVLEGFLRAVNNHQSSMFAFAGGIVHGIKESNFKTAFPRNEGKILGITFSVPKIGVSDFNASSVILWETAREEEDIDNIYGNLSKKTLRRENMAAFRFACISRYPLSELEKDCFEKHFPNVPMIGFEGLGEMGYYNIQDNNDQNDTTNAGFVKSNQDTEFAHSNTSIIILLSWGRITSTE
ncbi:uncharacterized protein LOC123305169 isoform X2 [Chrysoperla carnea]|uniref:uncharacterized protein LOC123305169 isoform X2 n=1 Tax=Chrysoperla carnea TaxID=189513 RepID=UPI001D08812D|nr:uncharacterized protein LOC123305169 isoform X2 [Chrysoperla carnea]